MNDAITRKNNSAMRIKMTISTANETKRAMRYSNRPRVPSYRGHPAETGPACVHAFYRHVAILRKVDRTGSAAERTCSRLAMLNLRAQQDFAAATFQQIAEVEIEQGCQGFFGDRGLRLLQMAKND